MLTKKILLIIILTCIISACQRNKYNVEIKLQSITFENNLFHNNSISWYYPYQMTFKFMVTSNQKFNPNDEKLVSLMTDNIFLKCQGKEVKIRTDNNSILRNNDTTIFYAYIVKAPIFDSIYSNNEFKSYLGTLRKCNIYYRLENSKRNIKKEFKVYFSKNFEFNFYHWKNDRLDKNQIGYPLDIIPGSIVPIKPIKGIEF